MEQVYYFFKFSPKTVHEADICYPTLWEWVKESVEVALQYLMMS